MNKKIISAVVLVTLFIGVFDSPLVFAWQNPTQNPPGGGGSFVIESGAPANAIIIKANGNVGVGATPNYKLDVNGKVYSSTELQGGTAVMKSGTSKAIFGSNSSTTPILIARDSADGGKDIYIADNGMVGINTVTPSGRLDVDGGAATLSLHPGTSDHVYLQFFADSQAATTRSGWIGFGSAGSNLLSITNEMGGNVVIPQGNFGIGTTAPGAPLDIGLGTTFTSGNAHSISWPAATTGAASLNTTGISVDFTNFTPNATGSTTYGIHLNDPVNANGTVYGIYINGTNWDYGIYSLDNVYFTTATYLGDTSTYFDTSGNLFLPAVDYIQLDTAGTKISATADAVENLSITAAGNILLTPAASNVGIGTATPLAKLSINGGLHVGGDSDPGNDNALIDGTLTVTGNANICNLVSYTGGGGSTQCPAGFYTWSGVALTSGYMLCCKVSNPI
ncbi:MAG TPA: hypothetical protein PLH22_00045 [Candidatus Colwellbacteria bacterium]|nr:hypothetical protein [Candidatus Colwellbacteria bacterium]